MAPELLAAFRPQEGTAEPHEGTAESTSFSHFTPIVPSQISVSQPVTSRNFHIKSAEICCDKVFLDEQKCIKEDNIFHIILRALKM